MSKLNLKKLLPVFMAISIAIVVAGIILFAVLGFNASLDRPVQDKLDVKYDSNIGAQNETTLQNFAEKTLTDAKISFEKEIVKDYTSTNDTNGSLIESSYRIVRYTLSGGDETAYTAAKDKIADEIAAHSGLNGDQPDIYYYADGSVSLYQEQLALAGTGSAGWRGAIALAVGAIVALVYVTFRFGVPCGVAGLVTCAHDGLFTAALFAVLRIPVYSSAPLLYAAVSVFVSALLWVFYANRIRAIYKDPDTASLPAETVADRARSEGWKTALLLAGLCGIVIAVLGLVGTLGSIALVLPAIIGVAVPVYSTFVFGPAVFAVVRKQFDKRRAVRNRVYVGKKKKADTEE